MANWNAYEVLIQRNAKRWRPYLKNYDLYIIFLLPLAYIILFKYIPIYGVILAFKNFSPTKGILGSEWVGLANFIKFFNSYQFERVLKNTLGLSIYLLAVSFPIPIIISLSLNACKNKAFKKIVQTAIYAPHFISTVVMVGMVVQFLHSREGFISLLIQKITGGEAINYLGKPEYFKTVYVLSDIWQHAGWGTIIYLAALSSIDIVLHEAAIVDGASKLKRIWHIDIPGITPTIIIMLILNLGQILDIGYEKVLLMQNTLNIQASEIIQTYVYKIGISSALPDYSYSTAIGLLNSVVSFLLIIIVNKIAKRFSETSLW